MSTSARASLRAEFVPPFVVVVPAVKPAAERTRTRRVGIASSDHRLPASATTEDAVIETNPARPNMAVHALTETGRSCTLAR